MGVAISPILTKKVIGLDDLRGKVLAVDAYNILYQFLTTIRMPDGTPLKDSSGRVTSHLVGLFARVTNLMERGIKLIFVFDGKKPVLKQRTIDQRKQAKEEAAAKYAAAVESEDVAAMKKFSARTVVLTPEMVQEAKDLLSGLGIPCVQAPSEAEAQAARYVQEGLAYAVVSQDADCLLFGAPRYIRNLSITGRKKKPGQPVYYTVEPELVELQENLEVLGLNQEQLLCLGILIGTDFNPGGIKGIGPKKALKLVQEHKTKEAIFSSVEWAELVPWQDIYDVLVHMPTDAAAKPVWQAVNHAKVEAMLLSRGFSKDRLVVLDKLKDRQHGLGEFL